MPTDPVRFPLPQNPGRHGHPAAVRDAAFLVYVGAGGQSLAKTSLMTGIHHETLAEWRDRDGWPDRIAEGFSAGYGAATSALAIAHALFPTLLRVAADRWLAILSDPKGHQPTQAKLIELALGMSGLVMPKAPTATIERDSDGRTRVSLRLSDLSQLTPEEQRTFAQSGAVPDRFRLPPSTDGEG
jgi:hypothetical protein